MLLDIKHTHTQIYNQNIISLGKINGKINDNNIK